MCYNLIFGENNEIYGILDFRCYNYVTKGAGNFRDFGIYYKKSINNNSPLHNYVQL